MPITRQRQRHVGRRVEIAASARVSPRGRLRRTLRTSARRTGSTTGDAKPDLEMVAQRRPSHGRAKGCRPRGRRRRSRQLQQGSGRASQWVPCLPRRLLQRPANVGCCCGATGECRAPDPISWSHRQHQQSSARGAPELIRQSLKLSEVSSDLIADVAKGFTFPLQRPELCNLGPYGCPPRTLLKARSSHLDGAELLVRFCNLRFDLGERSRRT